MKQRRWGAEENLAIVMEGLREKRSVSEICREHKICQTLYYRWRDKFLEGGKRAFPTSQGMSVSFAAREEADTV